MKKLLLFSVLVFSIVLAACTPREQTPPVNPQIPPAVDDKGGEPKTPLAEPKTPPAEQPVTKPPQKEQKAPIKKSTPKPTVREIHMESGNLYFKPNTLTLKLNEPVKIVFSNKGVHSFTVDELGVDVDLSGTSGVAQFTPTKEGTFEFYCNVGGHRAAGMYGKLTVTP